MVSFHQEVTSFYYSNIHMQISLHNNGISFFSGIDNLLVEIFDVKEQNNELINDIIKLTKNIK